MRRLIDPIQFAPIVWRSHMFSAWFRRLIQKPTGQKQRRRPIGSRPFIEILEDRTVPSFFTSPTFAVGTTPVSQVTGDFNGDSKADLAVVNQSSNTVSVLLGNGDG